MFVAHSTTRIRRARLIFLAAGLVPTIALVAWAVHLQSDAHRERVASRWQEAIGLPISIGRIEHPRPGVIRVHNCSLPAAGGRPAVMLSSVEIESSADEDRIRVPSLSCDPGTAAAAAELAGRWLADEIRFKRACVIDIGRFTWDGAAPRDDTLPGESSAQVRVECVKHDGSRAIRVVRRGESDDELRIVRHPPAASGSAPTYEIDATIATPVPVALVAIVAGSNSPALTSVGVQATVRGTLRASLSETGWQGETRASLAGIDIAAAAASVGDRAEATANVEISRLAWNGGRVTDALIEATLGEGWIERRLFDRIVLALAARPGVAASRVPPSTPLVFDAAACIVTIGRHGVQVQPSARLPGGLATTRGEVLLEPPTGPVTADRVAWLFSSPATTFGPTQGPGAWLLSVLPPVVTQPTPNTGDRRF